MDSLRGSRDGSTLRAVLALLASLLAHSLMLAGLSLPDEKPNPTDVVLVRIVQPPPAVMEESAPALMPEPADDGRPITAQASGHREEPSRESPPPQADSAGEEVPPEVAPSGFEEGAEEGTGVSGAASGGFHATDDAPGEGVAEDGLAQGVGQGFGEDATAGEPEIDTEAILAAYKAEALAAIEAHKTYPQTARRLRKEGEVRVQFTVSADGVVSDIQIVSSSGTEALDQAAHDAVQAASPLSPIPRDLHLPGLLLSVTLIFSLN